MQDITEALSVSSVAHLACRVYTASRLRISLDWD